MNQILAWTLFLAGLAAFVIGAAVDFRFDMTVAMFGCVLMLFGGCAIADRIADQQWPERG